MLLTDVGGYQPALIIGENNEIELGDGGGVCQVATTFFQAAVRAGMTILESNNHTLPSDYTDLALDAMVSGWSDVGIRNDFDFPVIIRTSAQGGVNYFEFLGDVTKKDYPIYLVQGEIQVIAAPRKEVDDPTLLPGEEVIEKYGQPGYRVATYINDGKKGTYKLRDNYYHPVPQVVRKQKLGADLDWELISIWMNI